MYCAQKILIKQVCVKSIKFKKLLVRIVSQLLERDEAHPNARFCLRSAAIRIKTVALKDG